MWDDMSAYQTFLSELWPLYPVQQRDKQSEKFKIACKTSMNLSIRNSLVGRNPNHKKL